MFSDIFIKQEYRCLGCNRLIARGVILQGYLEAKCPRCNKMLFFREAAPALARGQCSVLTTKNGIVVDASPSLEIHTGFSTEELIQKPVALLYADPLGVAADRDLSSLVNKFPYVRFDAVCKNKQGAPMLMDVWFGSFMLLDKEYVFRVMAPSALPVPELEALDTLAKENCHSFIADVDEQGNFIYVDHNAVRIFGFQPGEILGTNVAEYIDPEEVSSRIAGRAAAFARRDSFKFPMRSRHKDGHYISYETFGSPLHDARGNFLGYRYVNFLPPCSK